jgi:hypothetical protein
MKPKPPMPKITPEVARQLAEEGRQLRAEFRKRLKKMWTITPEERQAVSR